MNVLFSVKDITKTFNLSKKQQKILKTKETKKSLLSRYPSMLMKAKFMGY